MNLTERQQEVLCHLEGHLVVLAGPGSGKTHTLIEKIFHIFDRQIIPEPNGLLAVTFSNAAVTEINRRLWNKSFRQWDRVSVKTFHSFAKYLLQSYGSDVGIREDFEIIEGVGQMQLLESISKRHSSSMRPVVFRGHIERFKRQGIYPDCEDRFIQPGERRFLAAYRDYQKHLCTHNQLDFDDLIRFTIKLMNDSELASGLFTRYFRYVIVDEFQDTDRQQLEMATLFAKSATGSTIFADDDQAIYGFRGGMRGNVQAILNSLNADTMNLTENFRSPAIIVEAAKSLIAKDVNRIDKQSFAISKESGSLVAACYLDDSAEANGLFVE